MSGPVDYDAIGVAVVGLGYWGPNLVRNLQEIPQARIELVCDPRREALGRVARRYPGTRTTERYEDVLADPAVDAVVLATPVATHYPLASAALAEGKHVFVEKPLAVSTVQAEELAREAADRSLVLMVGHTFLYSPSVNVVRELIAGGDVGDVFFVSMARLNLGIHQPDVSVVWDLAPHDFSILRYWLGELPVHVSALSRGCVFPDKPDVAFVNLEFPCGAIGHVELAWLAPSKLRRTTVVGSRQMIVYDDTSSEPVRIFDSGVIPPDPTTFGEYHLSYRTGSIVSPRIDAAEPLLLEMTDFVEAIRTGSEPRASAQVALDVVRMIEAVDRSLALGGSREPIDAPPANVV